MLESSPSAGVQDVHAPAVVRVRRAKRTGPSERHLTPAMSNRNPGRTGRVPPAGLAAADLERHGNGGVTGRRGVCGGRSQQHEREAGEDCCRFMEVDRTSVPPAGVGEPFVIVP